MGIFGNSNAKKVQKMMNKLDPTGQMRTNMAGGACSKCQYYNNSKAYCNVRNTRMGSNSVCADFRNK